MATIYGLRGCCSGRAREEETLTNRLVFLRTELIMDIENYAFVTGDVAPPQVDAHGRHMVFDVAEDGNEELATRLLNLAHAECRELLYPFTKKETEEGVELDDRLARPAEYVIEMRVSKGFSRTTVLLLRELIHDYMICRVLTAWLGITLPEVMPLWRERLEGLKESIRTAASRRARPLRRKQSLF